MTTISHIHTNCKECVFAQYDQNTQIGCGLDYINRYKEKGVRVLEVYDSDKEFYVLNDKKCIGYRENKWLTNNNLSNDSDMLNRVSIYKETNTIDYIAIIDTKNLKLDDLINIFDQISYSKILPKKVFIIRYNDNENFKFENLKSILDNLQYAWKINTCVGDSTFSYFMDNIATFNKQARFVVSIIAPSDHISKVITTANDIVHNKLDTFMIVGNKDKTCLIFSSYVYKYGKYIGDNIFDNIDNYKEV